MKSRISEGKKLDFCNLRLGRAAKQPKPLAQGIEKLSLLL